MPSGGLIGEPGAGNDQSSCCAVAQRGSPYHPRSPGSGYLHLGLAGSASVLRVAKHLKVCMLHKELYLWTDISLLVLHQPSLLIAV